VLFTRPAYIICSCTSLSLLGFVLTTFINNSFNEIVPLFIIISLFSFVVAVSINLIRDVKVVI